VSLEVFLGYFTGLGLVSQELSRSTMIGTALFVHFLDGIMCRLLAYNSGYPRNLWTVLGGLFGVWAIVVLVLLPKRERV
jgi:hypothetical protein